MTDGTRVCDVCGNALPPQKKKFCGDTCRIARRNEQFLAKHHARKHDPEYQERRRRYAKTSYQNLRANPEALALQVERTADWRARNAEAMAQQNREWQIANADRVRAKIQRRRARLLDAFVEDVDPKTVFDRDSGICGICGERV